MSKTQDIDYLTFIKSYCQEIDVLKQTGYWSNKAGDFLPLPLSNWSKRPVRIYTSKHDKPIIEIQPTLGPVCNTTPLILAYTSSPGFAEHYDACRKCITEKNVHRLEAYLHTAKVEDATADTEYHVDPENQTGIAHEIIIYDHVTEPPDNIYILKKTEGRDKEGISVGPEFIAQPLSFI